MIWGAHEIDGRIAAQNAVKIRAALRQTIDATAIYQGYLDTHPVTSKNRPLERTKARSWAIMHVRFDNSAVIEVLKKVWSENYVLGKDSAKDAVLRAKEAKKSTQYTDWSKWKAGNRAKELLLRPAGSLEKILQNADITIKGLDRVGYERVGSALADSFALGLSPSRSAKLILDTIADPSRALTIAITEGSRAQSLATKDSYNELGLEQWEWSANIPCPECADNDGEVKVIGDSFASGDTEPPVHPNCKCVMLPVIPDYANMPNEHGVNDIMPNENVVVAGESNLANFQVNNGFNLTEDELTIIRGYQNIDYTPINNVLRMPNASIEKYNQKYYDKLNPVTWKKINNKIADLKNIINKTPATEQPTQVFRGVKSDAANKLSNLKVGAIYKEPGFASTSFDRQVAERFLGENGIMLEITVPQGVKGLSVEPFRDTTIGFVENEWLMAPNTQFKVLGKSGKTIKIEVLP